MSRRTKTEAPYVSLDAANSHPLMQSKYVQEILRLAGDATLYRKSPEELESIQTNLFRLELDFFYKNSKKTKIRMDNLKIRTKDC